MGPAFQLAEDRFSPSGAYGITAYGTSPYGGEDWPPYELPPLVVPSDDLQAGRHRVRGDIVHDRHGITVGARTWGSMRRWVVALGVVDPGVADALLTFHTAGVFRLLPYGDPSDYILVRWVETEFRPEPWRNGRFNIPQFTIEEIPS